LRGGRDLVLGQQLVQLGVVDDDLLLALLALQHLVDEPVVGGLGRRGRPRGPRLLGELFDVLRRLSRALLVRRRPHHRRRGLARLRARLRLFFRRLLLGGGLFGGGLLGGGLGHRVGPRKLGHLGLLVVGAHHVVLPLGLLVEVGFERVARLLLRRAFTFR